MLLETVERKVGTAVLCQQWRNGTSRIVVVADTRLRNRSRIFYAGKLSKCGQQITPSKVMGLWDFGICNGPDPQNLNV